MWLAYPPLIYLLVRLIRLGFGRAAAPGRLAPLLSLRTLLVGLPLILGARIVLSLVGHQEIDVSYESVIGAHRLLAHLPLYYNDPNHGDTYGPLTYLAYAPFERCSRRNSLSGLGAADAAAIFFDLGHRRSRYCSAAGCAAAPRAPASGSSWPGRGPRARSPSSGSSSIRTTDSWRC